MTRSISCIDALIQYVAIMKMVICWVTKLHEILRQRVQNSRDLTLPHFV